MRNKKLYNAVHVLVLVIKAARFRDSSCLKDAPLTHSLCSLWHKTIIDPQRLKSDTSFLSFLIFHSCPCWCKKHSLQEHPRVIDLLVFAHHPGAGVSSCSTSWRIQRWTAAAREPCATRARTGTRSSCPPSPPRPKPESSSPSPCAPCPPCATWWCCGRPARGASVSPTSGSSSWTWRWPTSWWPSSWCPWTPCGTSRCSGRRGTSPAACWCSWSWWPCTRAPSSPWWSAWTDSPPSSTLWASARPGGRAGSCWPWPGPWVWSCPSPR